MRILLAFACYGVILGKMSNENSNENKVSFDTKGAPCELDLGGLQRDQVREYIHTRVPGHNMDYLQRFKTAELLEMAEFYQRKYNEAVRDGNVEAINQAPTACQKDWIPIFKARGTEQRGLTGAQKRGFRELGRFGGEFAWSGDRSVYQAQLRSTADIGGLVGDVANDLLDDTLTYNDFGSGMPESKRRRVNRRRHVSSTLIYVLFVCVCVVCSVCV